MAAEITEKSQGDIWFVYDGECPICRTAARAFAVREAVGRLHTVNARTEKNHPVVQQVKAAALDLDEGMVVSYGGQLYHGKDALHIMALIGSDRGWFNRMNAVLFRSKPIAAFAYPFMKGVRNAAITLNGAGKIRNLADD